MQSADDRTDDITSHILPEDVDDTTQELNIRGALEAFDSAWFSRLNPRSMDLVGSYAGMDLFVIDGDSLCQVVLDDPLLALGRSGENSFQIMHAIWILEKLLSDFSSRRCNFDVVFFEDNRHLSLPISNATEFRVSSRVLARSILKHHLSCLMAIHQFSGIQDPDWAEYLRHKRPMFVMCNDGGFARSHGHTQEPPTVSDKTHSDKGTWIRLASAFLQRTFIYNLLSNGVSVTTLETADFHGSKIISFVYTQRRGISSELPSSFEKLHANAGQFVYTLVDQSLAQKAASSPPSSLTDWIQSSAVHFVQNSPADKMTPLTTTLLYVFIAHAVLLPHLSVSERAQSLQRLDPKLESHLQQEFLPAIFSSLYASLPNASDGSKWRPDIDGRLFLRLLSQLTDDSVSELSNLLGEEISKSVDELWTAVQHQSGTATAGLDLAKLAEDYPLSNQPAASSELVTTQTSPSALKVLPFDNPVFAPRLSTIQVDIEETAKKQKAVKKAVKVAKDDWDDDSDEAGSDEDEEEDDWEAEADAEAEAEEEARIAAAARASSPGPSTSTFSKNFASSDRGLYQDDKLAASRRKILPPRTEKPAPTITARTANTTANTGRKSSAAWLKMKRDRQQQKFMAQLHRQAETLTGAKGARFKQQSITLTNVTVDTLGMKEPYVPAYKKVAQASTPSTTTAKGVTPLTSRTVTPSGSRATSPQSARSASPKGSPRPGKEVKEKKGGGKAGGKKAQAVSSKDRLLMRIMEDKQRATTSDSERWWNDILKDLKSLESNDKKHELLQSLNRNKRLTGGAAESENWLPVEVALYRLHMEIDRWFKDPKKEEQTTRVDYAVKILRVVKDLYDLPGLYPSAINLVRNLLKVIGQAQLFPQRKSNAPVEDRKISFDFIQFATPTNDSAQPRYPFMVIDEHPIDFQLNHFGLYMDRSMESGPDPRVSFDADGWQRKVLDKLDARESVLVVAPTSAGKTFISFYAMEQVLSESDNGILIYVSPTKALVNQIAAEISARFSKDLKTGSFWAANTGDYKIHEPYKAQIMVLVPQVLSMMLLNPALARIWTPRIRWIIFDEIHSIGQEEGGAVWEQLILLAPCPIIGLSATIGNPDEFNGWLGTVQKHHGFPHHLIQHEHRYSHLRKFFYPLATGPPKFEGLDVVSARNKSNLQFIHPISVLESGITSLPNDLALESRDCLTLFYAMKQAVARHNLQSMGSELGQLEPRVFFASKATSFLQQKDVINYEVALKRVLSSWMKDDKDGQKLVQDIVKQLAMTYTAKDEDVPSEEIVMDNIVHLLTELHQRNDLPAILFNFDRKACEKLVEVITMTLQKAQVHWRENNADWKAKVSEWDKWQSRAKIREKDAERLKKAKPQEGVGREELERKAANQERPWQDSFDPDDPNPQFSFASEKTSYSKQELKDDIEDLRYANVPEWALEGLKLGVAVHHSGMSRRYRTLVEGLFRIGFLRVVVATNTLALGINAPCKTTVFVTDSPFLTALNYRQCAGRAGRRGFDLLGNVIFYGLPIDRVHRIIVSKIPPLTGSMPLTTTFSLRLCNLLYGSNDSTYAVGAIQNLLETPQLTVGSEIGKEEILHHLRFELDYLRRSNMLDRLGQPKSLYPLVAQLYDTEPSNLALSLLLRSGVIHRICSTIDTKPLETKRALIHLLAHLFGQRVLPKIFSKPRTLENIRKNSPSKVVLSPMPEDAQKVLQDHDMEILRIFKGYTITYATQFAEKLGRDESLPYSHEKIGVNGSTSVPFIDDLRGKANNVIGLSPFVANSGETDESLRSVEDLTRTARSGIHLDRHAIPSVGSMVESKLPLNAHILDFFIHGQVEALVYANRVHRGDIWFILQGFSLAMGTFQQGLEQLMHSSASGPLDPDDEDGEGGLGGATDVLGADDEREDPDRGGEGGDTVRPLTSSSSVEGTDAFPRKPDSITQEDWNVYRTLVTARIEFDDKFKLMWA